MNFDGANADDHFDRLLEAYDSQLAIGAVTPDDVAPTDTEIPSDLKGRFEAARKCLSVLEQAWPRADSCEFKVPERIGRFRINGQLGCGGFGIVYEAFDDELCRPLALKVQRPEAMMSPILRRRFQREASGAARLRHPNICTVYEVGKEGPQIWIATELCTGGSLADWLRAEHPKPELHAVARFIAAVADALAYSHEQGVLHRDLTPSNVLLEPSDPSSNRLGRLAEYSPKVIDFGLAKFREVSGQETRSGARLGTPEYMAPEQAAGQLDQVCPATDVYALGAILYALLVGHPPFQGETDLVTLRQIAEYDAVRPRRVCPDTPRDLEAICLKCLEKNPARRYATAKALASDLRRFLDNRPTIARPQTTFEHCVKIIRRRPALAALVLLATFGSLAFALQTWSYIGQLKKARDSAQESEQQAESARVRAESAAAAARASEAAARDFERTSSKFLYASRMRSAYQWLSSGDTDQALKLLKPYDRGGPWAHLRGFAWFHLQRRLNDARHTLVGHRGEVYGLAYSPNGRLLATGSEDGFIKLWDPANGQELASIPAHKSCVNSLAYSPDGTVLASCSCDHTIKLWSASTHALLATLDGPGVVESIAFSPLVDGRLASCGGDPLVRIWDLQTQEVVNSLDTKRVGAHGICWRGDAKAIFVAAATSPTDPAGPGVLVWDLEKDQHVTVRWDATSVALTERGASAYFGMHDGTVRLMAGTRATPLTLKGFAGKVQTVAVASQGDLVAAGGNDRTIRIWNVTGVDRSHLLVGHVGRIQSLKFSPDGSQLASASFDGTVKLWNRKSFSGLPLTLKLFVHAGCEPGHALALSADLRYVAVLTQQDQAGIYDLSDESLIGNLPVTAPTARLSFPTDQPILFGLSLNDPQTITEWDVSRWKPGRAFPMPAGQPNDLLLARDGRHLATTVGPKTTIIDSLGGRILWQFEKKKHDPRYTKTPTLFASPDRNTLAVTLQDEDPTWLIDSREELPRSTAPSLRAVSNGGRVIALREDNFSVTLFDAHLGKELIRLRESDVTEVVFSPDGKELAIGSLSSGVSLYDVATGQIIIRFNDFKSEIRHLQFSADGRKLAAVGVLKGEAYPNVEYPDGTTAPPGIQHNAQLHIWDASGQE